jgi:hypothetical protein
VGDGEASMAADPNDEAQWRAEFEEFGEESVRDSLHDGLFPELRRKNDFDVKSAVFSI